MSISLARLDFQELKLGVLMFKAVLWAIFILLIFTAIREDLLAMELSDQTSQHIITNPLISKRCEKLIQDRKEMVMQKQKTVSLINRGIKSYYRFQKDDKYKKEKMFDNLMTLKRELHLTKISIKHLEEKIVMRACPDNILR